MLKMMILNRVLLAVHDAINDARERETWNEHLQRKTSKNFQFKNARCFSSNSHDIECFCVNFDSARRMHDNDGANFIIVFSIFIELWCEKMKKFLRNDALLNKWILRKIYYDKKLTTKISFLNQNDQKLLKMIYDENESEFSEQISNVVMIINIRCFQTNVVNSFITKRREQINKKKLTLRQSK